MAVHKEHFDDHDEQNEQEKDNSKKRTRITIDISPYLRKRIKIAAAHRDLSVGEYVEQILDQAVPDEKVIQAEELRPLTQEGVDRLRRFHEQLKAETNGILFDDSTELVRQMREERSRYLMGEE
jgi:uncharacterized protein (DUF1778 family)